MADASSQPLGPPPDWPTFLKIIEKSQLGLYVQGTTLLSLSLHVVHLPFHPQRSMTDTFEECRVQITMFPDAEIQMSTVRIYGDHPKALANQKPSLVQSYVRHSAVVNCVHMSMPFL